MNNTSLKSKIEKAAGVYITAKSYKLRGETDYEGYVAAYAIIDGVQASKSKASTMSWQASERGYAVREALIQMADELKVTITDDERTAVERAEDAANTARMNLYCDTH